MPLLSLPVPPSSFLLWVLLQHSFSVFFTTMGKSGARLPTQQSCAIITKNFPAVDSPAGKIPKGNMSSSSDFKCPEMAHAVSFYPNPLLSCRSPVYFQVQSREQAGSSLSEQPQMGEVPATPSCLANHITRLTSFTPRPLKPS